MGADFDTNSLHVVLTLYGATGYVMRAPPWKPACVQDDVTFLGMWGGELMSARALNSRPEAGSSEWCSRVVAKTSPCTWMDQLTKAPFFGKIENTVVKRGSLAPPPALAP